MAIELTEDERWELLEREMVMRLSTVDPAGRPHVVPIWFYADRDYDAVYFSTPEDTRKVRDVEENPKVSLTVDEGEYYFELRAVVLEGDASVVEDEAEREHVERQWCRKYFDSDERADYMDLLYRGRPWDWFKVEPGRWLSWDNTKIDLDRLRQA
ncbi:MAG: pyridoxamine 5'-phosphate oxidase family protein [Haloferacaceae archaeon]